EGGGLVGGVDDGLERGLNFAGYRRIDGGAVRFRGFGHRYCSSIFEMASGPAKTASNILCLRTAMSAKSSDCTRITACMRTISSTASSATIMELRVAQVSKNSVSEMGSSVTTRRWR